MTAKSKAKDDARFVNNVMCEHMNKYARTLDLENVIALLSEKHKEYVLFHNNEPVFASPSIETIGSYIDRMKFLKTKGLI